MPTYAYHEELSLPLFRSSEILFLGGSSLSMALDSVVKLNIITGTVCTYSFTLYILYIFQRAFSFRTTYLRFCFC
jgi:hypothetical protein